jgi:DNA-binding MarR family transcriptional regulator
MPEPAWLDADQQRAWRALLEVHARLLAHLHEDLVAAHGIGLPDYEVLVHLSESPDHRLRMAELAERLLLSPSGVTRRLDGLVREGLVAREACPTDRRGSFAVLTPAGWTRLQEAAPTHVAGVRRYLIDNLTPAELCSVAGALERVGAALGPGPSCPSAAGGDQRSDGPLT